MSAKARRILALLNDPRNREMVVQAMNRDNMDAVRPIGGEVQGMKLLSEMNSLVDDHDEFVKSLAPRVDVL